MNAVYRVSFSLPLLMLGLWSFCLCQNPQQKPEALLEAVRKGDLQQVISLLNKGIDVNCRDEYRYTPLVLAAKYGRVEIAKVLCDRGADTNAMPSADAKIYGENGFTPLLWAAFNCDNEMAMLLLDRGADVGRPGDEGDTPLMIAAQRNCMTLVRGFIEKGAPVNAVNQYDGATALTEAVKCGNLDVVDYLISKGVSLAAKDRSGGRSLLSMAAASGSLAEVRYFLEKGLPVNGRDDNGCTAVYYALRPTIESRYILEYLVEHGGDPKIINKLGISPLMQASFDGLPWEVGFFIEKGAAVNDTDFRKETPLHYACRGIPKRLQPVFRGGRESEATIKLLLDKGAHVNVIDRNGKTPLMNAASNEAPRVIDLLLNHGALVNAQDQKGWTALMHAADWDQTAVIKVLAQRGADLNLRNSKGETALVVAKERPATAQAYELLKSLGAKE